MPFNRDQAGEPLKGSGDAKGFAAGNQQRGRRGLGLDHSDKVQKVDPPKVGEAKGQGRDTHGFAAGNQDDRKRGRGSSRKNRYDRGDE